MKNNIAKEYLEETKDTEFYKNWLDKKYAEIVMMLELKKTNNTGLTHKELETKRACYWLAIKTLKVKKNKARNCP
ncbi:MAG: hypothetical protein M0Q94_13475 [Candidatus Cloacimonetes bacterium]|nr:hypothetical protein [Candidatus Cloacimonadota bacterium]